jgi:acetylornithine deacetylase/succinyl-diaminopimelate desuccinylase-like protein
MVAAVVQEEVGGLGTSCQLDALRPAAAVVGEPSGLALAFGHRGRTEVEVAFVGRAGHAARPDRAVSPVASLARFALALGDVAHDDEPSLGRSSAVITQLATRPASPNVIPAEAAATVDWRHVPSETPGVVSGRLLEAARRSADDGVRCEARMPERPLVSWTGHARSIPRLSRSFATDPAGALFRACLGALADASGRQADTIAWDFASDGGWLHAHDVPVVGYGPGETTHMHCRDESVPVRAIQDAVTGYAALLLALDAAAGDAP